MKKRSIVSIIVVVLLVLAALVTYICLSRKNPVAQAPAPVHYVSEIIGDSSMPEHRMIVGYNAKDASSAVFILGTGDRCSTLCDAIVGCDDFDNVDGSRMPDGLKDFAGESICTVTNFGGFDLSETYSEAAMRDLTVRNAVMAMDTLCFVSPYDRSGMGKKPLAKMLVLASPEMVLNGRYDVDSLFHALGCTLPVISPAELMLDAAFAESAPGKKFTVGVLCSPVSPSAAAYDALIRKKAAKAGVDSVACITFAAEAGTDALKSFLDSYSASAPDAPIDVLLIDDMAQDPAVIEESLLHITSVMNAESMTYGNLISKNFRILDPRPLVCGAIYSYLRSSNLFTHFISQPKRFEYMLLPKEGSERSLIMLPFNERYVPEVL